MTPSTIVTDEAVATVATEKVKALFGGSRQGMARLRGFTEGEVTWMVQLLREWAEASVELVVIADGVLPNPLKPYAIAEGKSATTYRNQVGSCVFFEIDRFSDEQGLRNVTLLDDGNLLREGNDSAEVSGDEGVDVNASLSALNAVWKIRRGTGTAPTVVRQIAEDLVQAMNERERQLALREWIRFAHRYCEALPVDRAVDGTQARKALGLALPALRLFPDPDLGEIAGDVPRRRRLSENILAAEDRSRSGREIDRDELVELAGSVEFRDVGGEHLEGKRLEELRRKLVGYLQAWSQASTEGIDFRFWRQLFEHTTRRRGVGTRVSDEIEGAAPQRLDELDSLDVVEELDANEPEAAQRLLDEESEDEDLAPLSDLLSSRLRKAVERIANPTAKATTQPLRHLLRLFHAIAEEEGESRGILRLEVRKSHGKESNDGFSQALFCFLFGATLRSVAERTSGLLEVAEDLVNPDRLGVWKQSVNVEDSDVEDEGGDGWDALRLQLRWSDEVGGTEFFEWRPKESPGFAALAKAVYQPDVWSWRSPGLDFDEWCGKALEPGPLIGGHNLAAKHPLVGEWLSQRSSVLTSVAKNGLSPEPLHDYVSIWQTLLNRAYTDHVPQGASDPAVGEFLSVDVHRSADESPTILGTHPLRLRWIAANFAKMADLLVDARKGALRLNEVNEGFFFDKSAQASPHEQPAVLCDDAHVYVAVREDSWHERYEVVRTRTHTSTDWLADLDDSSLDEMAGALVRYVDAYPYKADGLHLLIVAREGGARMVRELVGRFLNQSGVMGRRSDMQVSLHVVCPASEFSPVSDAISEFDDGSDRAERDFPRFKVVLHEWAKGADTPTPDHFPDQVDIAVVPNLFSATTRCQEATRPESEAQGEFDPWLDAPTKRESASGRVGAKSVSRILIPEQRDELLMRWSTVNVRHFRGAKVGTAESDGGEVDVVTLNVAVTDGESFFAQLHQRAHWVVTLDAFVGRRQIEALENRPEVITVKQGLGKGGAYTLVVSSQAGRDFIVHRLSRRLLQQVGHDLEMDPRLIAEKIYDRARELAPGTLLRALGLGRTAQELVGLVISQRLVKEFEPVDFTDGFESWIALDERPDWFAGNQHSRADLVRICGVLRSGKLHLSLTVVEAKLRDRSAVRKAESQLDSTAQLFQTALVPNEESPPHDGELWRRALLDAIDESAREPREGGGWTFRARWNGRPDSKLHPDIKDAIRRGDYELEAVTGVACTIDAASDAAAAASEQTPNGRHKWIQATRHEVAQILKSIGAWEEPATSHGRVLSRDTPESLTPSRQREGPEGAEGPEGHERQVERSPISTGQRARKGLTEVELRARYQRVLDTFAEYGVEVMTDDRTPCQEGPGFFVFRVRPGPGVQPSRLTAHVDNLKYSLRLPAELQPRAFIDRGAVVFEVPKAEDDRYYVDADEIWRPIDWPQDRLWVAIGEDVRGDVVSIDFSSSETPHLLIGGITGAGKSIAVETILLGLIHHYPPGLLRISAIDPKRTELTFLEDHPHLEGQIGFDADEARALLDDMVEEMESRYVQLRNARVKNLLEFNHAVAPKQRLPWRLVILDEFADLTSDRDAKKSIEASLQRLTQKARAAGIHVIVATQKPSADVISTTVRSNLGAQLALRVKTATDSRIIMDATGAEALAGNGDAILKGAGNTMTRLQCAKIN